MYRWHTLYHCGPEVSSCHAIVWNMCVIVGKGFANRRKELTDCCPGYARRIGDMNDTS